MKKPNRWRLRELLVRNAYIYILKNAGICGRTIHDNYHRSHITVTSWTQQRNDITATRFAKLGSVFPKLRKIPKGRQIKRVWLKEPQAVTNGVISDPSKDLKNASAILWYLMGTTLRSIKNEKSFFLENLIYVLQQMGLLMFTRSAGNTDVVDQGICKIKICLFFIKLRNKSALRWDMNLTDHYRRLWYCLETSLRKPSSEKNLVPGWKSSHITLI